MGCIYSHICIINNKPYVGKSKASGKAVSSWRWHGGSGYRNCPKMWNAIQKYGWKNFKHIILEDNIPEDKLDEREIYWIAQYDSYNNGYNCTTGGGGVSDNIAEWEIKIITDNYKQYDATYCQQLIDIEYQKRYPNKELKNGHYRSLNMIYAIASKYCKIYRKRWSDEYERIIDEKFLTEGFGILKYMPDKTRVALKHHLAVRGIVKNKSWKNDIPFLNQYYEEYGPDYCAIELGRTRNAVLRKASYLGLTWKHHKAVKKKTLCIELNKVFDSVCAAAKFANVKTPSIKASCEKGIAAGKLEDGIKLHWKYID